MNKKFFILCVASFTGFLIMAFSIIIKTSIPPASPPFVMPALSPYPFYVSGNSLVEAQTENIEINADLQQLIVAIYVKVGEKVKEGTPLLKLYDLNLQSQREMQMVAVDKAQATLDRLHLLPRLEEIAPLESAVSEAKANAQKARALLERAEALGGNQSMSGEEKQNRRFAWQAAQAQLEHAKNALALQKAGAWLPDLKIAETEVLLAKAELRTTEEEIARTIIKAPCDGEVLQINAHLGELSSFSRTLILFGNTQQLHLRALINEGDAWRIRPGAPAVAFVRSKPDLKVDLKFERINPYLIPKRSFTGDTYEIVDSRVIEVIFSIEKPSFPLYPGQQMDVFIKATE